MKRQELRRARTVKEEHAAAERTEAERKAEGASMAREVEDYARYKFRHSELKFGRENAKYSPRPVCRHFSPAVQKCRKICGLGCVNHTLSHTT